MEFSREKAGRPLGNVSYHVKSLERAGLIEVSDVIPRRGAIEHCFRPKQGKRWTLASSMLDTFEAA